MVSKYSSHSGEIDLLECLKALFLLENSNIQKSQHISIFSAASTKAEHVAELNDDGNNDNILNSATYESIASIIRQCDKYAKNMQKAATSHSITISVNFVQSGRNNRYCRGRYGQDIYQLSPKQLRARKLFSRCRNCKKFGHWDSDYNADGTIKNGLPSNDKPISTGMGMAAKRNAGNFMTA